MVWWPFASLTIHTDTHLLHTSYTPHTHTPIRTHTHRSGVAVYTTSIPTSLLQQGAQLYVGTAVRDFATIYLNNTTRVARVDRTTAHDALVLPLPMVGEEEEDGGHDGEEDQHTQQKQQQHAQHKQQQHVPMHVVVEAMGHNTFFDHKYPNNAFDLKGLLTPLALNGVLMSVCMCVLMCLHTVCVNNCTHVCHTIAPNSITQLHTCLSKHNTLHRYPTASMDNIPITLGRGSPTPAMGYQGQTHT